MSSKVTLAITSGNLKGQEFTFDTRTTCIIGRAKDCYPNIPDDEKHRTISRYHRLLDINPPDIRVRDFGSKNGTFVNNQKSVSEKHINLPKQWIKFNSQNTTCRSEMNLHSVILLFELALPLTRKMPKLSNA